jgi:hypothetical protein
MPIIAVLMLGRFIENLMGSATSQGRRRSISEGNCWRLHAAIKGDLVITS